MGQIKTRRNFIKTTGSVGIGLGLLNQTSLFGKSLPEQGKRIGIIGLDTSHSVAFTKEFNNPNPDPELGGYRVVAAYPKGSEDIESCIERIPEYTKQVSALGVEIMDSIEALLEKVDVVLLETNDGRPHLKQALPVLKAGKKMFIDKPMTTSLGDAVALFDEAERRKVPVFSCSALRFMESLQPVANGKIGKVIGASTYSPATLEKTHPDLFWYGIHGVEVLFTVMGAGCKSVTRVHTDDTDLVVGLWADNRIGTFRGTRSGKHDYGGFVYGEKDNVTIGPFLGYKPLLLEIVKFFQTGIVPFSSNETLEIIAFMEAADESKRLGGVPVSMDKIWKKVKTLKK
jgi:predicted dehydrogenase